MEMIYIIPVLTLVIFSLARFIEMKFIDKQMKPLKVLIRDSVIVFVCAFIANIILSNTGGSIQNFFNVVTDAKTISGGGAEVFTDIPNF